jgi:hypothetical protein
MEQECDPPVMMFGRVRQKAKNVQCIKGQDYEHGYTLYAVSIKLYFTAQTHLISSVFFFWVVMPCGHVGRYRCSGETYCLYH